MMRILFHKTTLFNIQKTALSSNPKKAQSLELVKIAPFLVIVKKHTF